jgi:hypothetical protein
MMIRAFLLIAGLLGMAPAPCLAADPVEVLPEAMFATGNGCAVIKKKLPEDVETFTFHALYNTNLYGPELACGFTDATESAIKSGTLWTVKANCRFGDQSKPSIIVIKQEVGKEGVQVSMTNAQGTRVDLGDFAHCGPILTD